MNTYAITENQSSDQNRYLKTLLCPWKFCSRVPDLNMTASRPKTVHLTRNIPAPASGEGLFLYLPHSRGSTLKYFIWDTTAQTYMWSEDIPYDQPIEDAYDLARFVSGGMKLKSATTSGGQFDVAGTYSAINFQDLPPLSSLTFEKVSAYARNNRDTLQDVTVQEGLVALANPDGNHDFRPLNTNSVSTGDTLLDAVRDYEVNTSGFSGASVNFYDSDNDAVQWIPPELWGKFEASFFVDTDAGPGQNFTIRFYYDAFPPGSANPILVSTTMLLSTNGPSGYISKRMEIPGILREVSVTYLGPSIGTVRQCRIGIKSLDYYARGFRGPGALVAFQAVTPGQQINVNAVANYEVVPNSELAREVVTDYDRWENPLEMELAEYAISAYSKFGIGMLMTYRQYSGFCGSATLNQLTSNAYLARASGFSDFFKKIWGFLKPVVHNMAPVAGAMYGPAGQAIGQIVADYTASPMYRNRASSDKPLSYDTFAKGTSSSDEDLCEYLGTCFDATATMLNSEEWQKAAATFRSRCSIELLEALVDVDLPLKTDTQARLRAREAIQNGLCPGDDLKVTNSFVTVSGRDSTVGFVQRDTRPRLCRQAIQQMDPPARLAWNVYSLKMVYQKKERNLLLTIPFAVDEDFVSSIGMAWWSSFRYQSIATMHLNITVQSTTAGGSAGLAAFFTCCGYSSDALLTGGVRPSAANGVEGFIPGELEKKSMFANSQYTTLVVAAPSTTNIPPKQAIGCYYTAGKLDNPILFTNVSQMPQLSMISFRSLVTKVQNVRAAKVAEAPAKAQTKFAKDDLVNIVVNDNDFPPYRDVILKKQNELRNLSPTATPGQRNKLVTSLRNTASALLQWRIKNLGKAKFMSVQSVKQRQPQPQPVRQKVPRPAAQPAPKPQPVQQQRPRPQPREVSSESEEVEIIAEVYESGSEEDYFSDDELNDPAYSADDMPEYQIASEFLKYL